MAGQVCSRLSDPCRPPEPLSTEGPPLMCLSACNRQVLYSAPPLPHLSSPGHHCASKLTCQSLELVTWVVHSPVHWPGVAACFCPCQAAAPEGAGC